MTETTNRAEIGKRISILACTLAGIGVLVTFAFNFQSDSVPSTVASALFKNDFSPIRHYRQLDSFLKRNIGEGNVLLRVEGFRPEEAGGPKPHMMALICFRCLYRLYPKKVFVGDPSKPSKRASEALLREYKTDPEVLKEFDIRTVLTLYKGKNGVIRPRIERVQ